jgi:hypothetical protein
MPGSVRGAPPPANLDAHDCFLRASDYVYQWTDESTEAGLALFYKAIELDPNYAQAHAFALQCYIWRNTARGLTDEERRETARLAREAVRLGKDDAFSLSWAGFLSLRITANWKMARHFLIEPWRSIQIWLDRGI